MPDVEVGDVVVVFTAMPQERNGEYSLKTASRTAIYVYDAKHLAVCKDHRSVRSALKGPTQKTIKQPAAELEAYVLWMFQKIDRADFRADFRAGLPNNAQFSQLKRQSLNVKDKFSLLHDVRHNKFADLIVRVVKTPYYDGVMISLWVSDYTENSCFFHKTSDNAEWADGEPVRDGDPYGDTNGWKKQAASMDSGAPNWDGPMGKMSMQITCWDPHADFVQEHVKMGDWIRLRNVQIKFGRASSSDCNLEGALREDRDRPAQVNVELLDVRGNREKTRLVEALRRKRDYEEKQKQSHETDKEKKRKAEEPAKDNAKIKRQRTRKAIEKEQVTKEAALGLNELIVSENPDKAIDPLSTVLKPVLYPTTIANQEVHLKLPFTCANYRTNVRVVDFHPVSLKDFAVGRTSSEYDILSNNEDSDSESASSGSSAHSYLSRTNRRRIWEWRFALKLEEVSVSPKAKTPAQTWVVVDNPQAQLLLGLDATDLHDNDAAVDTLRERLFKLWGNLEERKIRLENKRRAHDKAPLRAPPPDSSDESNRARDVMAEEEAPAGSQLSNRPFTCCIKQYGIKVRAQEGEEATAGEGKKWQRMFGLFGTKIKDE